MMRSKDLNQLILSTTKKPVEGTARSGTYGQKNGGRSLGHDPIVCAIRVVTETENGDCG